MSDNIICEINCWRTT